MIDSRHRILGGLLAVAIIVIVLMRGCGPVNDTTETVIRIDTVLHETVYDTTWYDTTIFKYITVRVPVPYYDTTIVYESMYTQNDFDQMMKHPSIYEDSIIKDDTIHLKYRATVRGYLDKMELGYKIVKPFLVESNTVTDIEITKVKRPISFYIGLNAGANASGPTQFSPMAELATRKMSYSLGYDILSSSVVVGIKAHISFRRKPSIIPRP